MKIAIYDPPPSVPSEVYHLPRWRSLDPASMWTLVTAPLFGVAGMYGGHAPWLARLLQTCGGVFTLHHARPYGSYAGTDVVRVADLCLGALLAVGVVVEYPTIQTTLCYAAAAATWQAVLRASVKHKSPLHAWFHLLALLPLC